MAIKFRCKSCEEVIRAPDKARGKVVECESCGERNKVPAGKKKTKKKKKKGPPPRRPRGDDDFLGVDGSAEDARYVVCQKCGEQFTADEDSSACPYCGYDYESGGYTKKARRAQLKEQGLVDPTEFFETAKGESAKFAFDKWSLSLRSAAFLTVPVLACLGAVFLTIYNGKTPPKIFFGFLAVVFGLGALGWLVQYCQILVRAKLEGDEKLDRVTYDFFQCCAEGVTLLGLQVAWVIPCIVAVVGAILIGQEQVPVGVGLIVASPLLILPFYPVIFAHLSMPINWPAWAVHKGMAIWSKLTGPAMYWTGFTLLAMLPGLVGIGVGIGVFYEDIESVVEVVNDNAELGYQKYLYERGDIEEDPGGEYAEVDYEPLIPPLIIIVVSVFYIGYAWSYPARMLAWFALYFKKPLQLIEEKKQRKYVAKKRKTDEDGNIIVERGGPPEVVIRLIFTILFYVVVNLVSYFSSGTLLLPPGVGEALGLERAE